MKTQLIFLIILTLISCQNKKLKKENLNPKIQTEQKITSIQIDSLQFDNHLTIYDYNSTYTDSSLVYEVWRKNNSIIKKEGIFYHKLPFESEFVNESVIKEANGNNELEIFLENICETGGTSAWNKYYFEYDNQKRPLKAKHYKAWWYEGLIDLPQPEKPEYFLGERLEYEYGKNWTTVHAYNDKSELIETIEKRYDINNKLIYEHWDAWDWYRYKVFYEYK